jgi:hypothetical protein
MLPGNSSASITQIPRRDFSLGKTREKNKRQSTREKSRVRTCSIAKKSETSDPYRPKQKIHFSVVSMRSGVNLFFAAQ